ncbi:unnamed protein product [Leptosia nina]|uniref:Chitin-binding type-2 domain-containing protein n=1 Tax=Leptosia nina TaxID=320188 RepID=A0AAV1JIX8_9NEOP
MRFVVLIFAATVASSIASDAPAPSTDAAPAADAQASPCSRRNVFMKVAGKCDAYVECIDFAPVQKSCPDGLHYNEAVAWPNYPCGYPSDVPCRDRSAQAAKPTPDCPHQYGYFPSPTAAPTDCGQYRMCIAGKAVDLVCPTGLAFNFETSQCDWPFLVSSCDAASYLGYQCPAASFDESGNPVVTNHKFDGNCYAFYSCQDGRPRLLSCDAGLAFDPVSSRCVDADDVACSDSPAVPTTESKP